jgi:GMP synthase (glutamine-hydrolysing)
VAFVLLNRALGEERVLGLHVDNGFMRAGETALVREALTDLGFHNLHVVDASEDFLLDTEGLVDPEAKRKAIGTTFLRVKDRALRELDLDPEAYVLGQGTLYPDTIESGGTHHAAVIKTHHNRIDTIEALIAEGKVVEPLAQLYKDEVRDLGRQLGLPDRLVNRHPFPGPGLAVRALCARGDERFDDLDDADRRVREIAERRGFGSRVLPLRSVGVQGDFRTYAHPAALWGPGGWPELERISTEITNRVRSVNRVVTLLSPGAVPDLRPKRAFLDRSRMDLLRRADAIAMGALEAHGLTDEVSQMPTVLVPLSTDGRREVVVLRPVVTPDFMTARFAQLPRAVLTEVADRIVALGGIDAVFCDVTHKPPGTIEWE